MSGIADWNLAEFRRHLRERAAILRLHPKLRLRFDESDLVQETLLRAAKVVASFRGETDRERLAWLDEIQNTVFLDKYREQTAKKRDVRREREVWDALTSTVTPWQAELVDEAESPLSEAIRKDNAVLVLKAIRRLPDDQRQVVMLRAILQLELCEVANAINKSEGAVAGLYRRGITRLREILETMDP